MSFLGNAALILALLVAIYSIAASLLDSRKTNMDSPPTPVSAYLPLPD